MDATNRSFTELMLFQKLKMRHKKYPNDPQQFKDEPEVPGYADIPEVDDFDDFDEDDFEDEDKQELIEREGNRADNNIF